MIRLALIGSMVTALVAAGGTQERPSLPPGAARLDLQTRLISTKRLSASSTSRIYGLYNRPAYKHQLGTAVVILTNVSSQWRSCKAYLRLSRGTIIADALVSASATLLTFAVLGGTGYYANAAGTITFQPLGDGVGVLLGTLQGF